MVNLKPITVSEYDINRVASGMNKYFWENIFQEIFDILNDDANKVYNSKDDVINAIKSGRIWYEDGAFRTSKAFANNVSKTLEDMGAVFRYGKYYIDKSKIPFEYLQALGITEVQTATKLAKIGTFLGGLKDKLEQIDLKKYIQDTVKNMFKKVELEFLKDAQEKKVPLIELNLLKPKVDIPKKEVKKVESYWEEQDKKAQELRISIEKANKKGQDTQALKDKLQQHHADAYGNAPTFDFTIDDVKLDDKSRKIAEDYTYNMKYWVKNWEAKNIVKMREDVLKMIEEGARVPRIQEYFEKRWKIAKDKAKFLADNESRLANSVIQATNAQLAGSETFKWGKSASKERRKLHLEYDGKIFRYDDPPIIDEVLGLKGLPRQIWNCKCFMIPQAPDMRKIWGQSYEIRNAKRNIFTRIKYAITNSKQCDNNTWRYRRFGEG